MGLVGILVSLGLLIWLSFRGWSVLLLAPAVALLAAALAGEPLLAHWTQTFMGSAAQIYRPVLPDIYPRRVVRKAHGRQRIRADDRQFHEHQTWSPAGNSCRRACGSAGHLRRRKSFRRFFCPGADGARIISGSRHPAATDARSNCSWDVDIHHVGNARNARDSEHDSDALFRNHAICGAWIGNHCVGNHVGVRIVVAWAR